MEFSGLNRYFFKRLLIDEERALHLRQKQRLDFEPHEKNCQGNLGLPEVFNEEIPE